LAEEGREFLKSRERVLFSFFLLLFFCFVFFIACNLFTSLLLVYLFILFASITEREKREKRDGERKEKKVSVFFVTFTPLALPHSTLTSPSNTSSAGPVINTVPPTPPPSFPASVTHSMNRGPPGRSTRHFLSSLPSNTPATTVAQAPVPQASVGPAPRSQTRILQ